MHGQTAALGQTVVHEQTLAHEQTAAHKQIVTHLLTDDKKKLNFSLFLRLIFMCMVFCSETGCGTFNVTLPWIFLVMWPAWWWIMSYVAHFSKKKIVYGNFRW